jgi:phosphatidylglycerophosphatase A
LNGAAVWFQLACLTVCGSGYAKFASGSWGSLVSVLLYLAMWCVLVVMGAPRWSLDAAAIVGIAIASWMSVAWGEWACARWGRKDPKPFVLDEFAGQWMSLLFLPVVMAPSWPAVLFVLASQLFLFRVFDVLKPPPARQLEALPFGWGVLCDDLFAGVYANLAGQLIWRFTPVLTWLHLDSSGDFTFLIPTSGPTGS